MQLTVDNYTSRKNRYNPTFRGPIDGVLTGTLRMLDVNPTANAAGIDLGAMVGPRTYFDTKDRNKYAGAETFVRELFGTINNCFAAGILGAMIAKVATKYIMPDVKTNPKSWFSDDSIKTLKSIWDKSDNNLRKYSENVLNGLSGKDGYITRKFTDIEWEKTEWFDEDKWAKFRWDNPTYANIQNKLKDKEGFVQILTQIIEDKNISKKDKKQVFEIFETRLTNALKVHRDVELDGGIHKLNTTLVNIIRDTYDMGKDVLSGNNIDAALKKIKKVNNVKIFGALTIASLLGISVQKINRMITEKRTGKKGFVGDEDYMTRTDNPAQDPQKKDNHLLAKKILASAGMIAMLLAVMKVKNPKDFVRKLQFTGPVSTGNAIKTVYGFTIVGRFFASDSTKELRESVVRDYFGFLNWLVLGGFASKAVANILDPKMENLFNIKKEGKGLKHWLNDVSLKTHAEIAAQGKTFAKKNIKKLNTAHIAGLAYSTLMLGVLLPKINTKMSKENKN